MTTSQPAAATRTSMPVEFLFTFTAALRATGNRPGRNGGWGG